MVKAKLVLISAGMLTGMAKDKRFTSVIPGLRNILVEPRRCTTCSRNQSGYAGVKGNPAKQRETNNILYAISKMDRKKKAKLKSLLNTQQARVRFVNSSNKRVEYTF